MGLQVDLTGRRDASLNPEIENEEYGRCHNNQLLQEATGPCLLEI